MKLRKKVKVLEQMIAEQDDKIERIEDNQKSFDSSLQKFSVAFYKGTPLEKMAWEDITEKPIGEPQEIKPDNLRAKIVSQLDKLIGQYDIDTFEVENTEGAEIDYTNIRKDFKLYPSITVKFKEKKQNKTEIHNPRYDNRI